MLRAIDFCCGAGGMTHGLLAAGIDVIGGIDNDISCKATYEAPGNNTRPNGDPSKFMHADMETLEPDELAREFSIEADDDSLLFVGCTPCQFWSRMRTSRAKSLSSRLLLNRFRFFVEHFQPGYILVENVPGLLKSPGDSGLTEFLEYLTLARYTFDSGVLIASQYGVPQKRRRFVLVASRFAPVIKLPAPDGTGQTATVRAFIGVHNQFPAITAGHRDNTTFLHTAAALSDRNLKRIRKTPHDGGERSAWKGDVGLQLDAYAGKDHYFRDVYGRMQWDRPAPTITTRFNSLSNGRFGHPNEDRALSLREGATLQTFSRNYVFEGNQASVARNIGNAVPPFLAKRVGQAIMDHWAQNGATWGAAEAQVDPITELSYFLVESSTAALAK